jgi:tetratricopeptide (TPR) repeat protein/predicted Ser/Thr protein kinase
MPSILEAMREYKHLSARKRAEGTLSPSLEERLVELESVVKAGVKNHDAQSSQSPHSSQESAPPNMNARPRAASRSQGTPLPAAFTPPPAVTTSPKSPSAVARMKTTSAPNAPAHPTPVPSTRTPEPKLATASSRIGDPVRLAERPGLFNLVAARLPDDTLKRLAIIVGVSAVVLALDLVIAMAIGLPIERKGAVLQMVALIGGASWIAIYPGLLMWREHAANAGTQHINEPDFEAKIPTVEPIVAAVSALGLVLWIWLGGHTNEGIRSVLGLLAGVAIGMTTLAFAAAFVLRPIVGKKVKARALRQYVEGGMFHLNKGNPKRARRLLERAFDEARGGPQHNEIAKHLKQAAMLEADELRKKGHTQKADEVIEQASSRAGMELLVGWSGAAAPANGRANAIPREDTNENISAGEILAQPPKPPMLLQLGQVTIEDGSPRRPDADELALRERAKILERRNRVREAVELFVQSGIPVPRAMAQEAIKQYIAGGLLRSADAIFEALGERQGPEFYQAVVAEWAKDGGGDPPSDQCLRIAMILTQLGSLENAARIACRGALTKKGKVEEKKGSLELALKLCKKLGMEPPVEILEEMGDYVNAARAYEHEGRKEEALRCYKRSADQLIQQKEPAAKLIPLLSKIFIHDPDPESQYLDPLAQHVLETNASGPSSMKILLGYRKKKKDDERLSARLLQLFGEAQMQEEAAKELDVLSKLRTSNPEALAKDYRVFVDRFPDQLKSRAQYVRLLLKLGRIEDAAAQVHQFIARGGDKNEPEETMALLETLLDWGHDDNELRKALGLLRIQRGKGEEGLAQLERYVREGGRDPDAIKVAKDMLSEDLAQESGSPNHERLLRLGRFLLSSGDPEASIQHLERGRVAAKHKAEAELLLGRAYAAVGSPKKAIGILQKAINGRALKETYELHYELARAQELAGAYPESRRIDRAIADANPDFILEYEKGRPRADRADTAWAPESVEAAVSSVNEHDSTEHTDPGASEAHTDAHPRPAPKPAAKAPARPAPRQTSGISPISPSFSQPLVGDDMGANLGEALLPRYRLLRKLGAGGMGEVHLAEDVDLGRYVAIKVLRRSLANDLFILKFKEEARIVAQLTHANIVQIFDLGQRGNYSYIVMEYVDGPDLASLINKSNGFERKRLIRIVASVADAMDYAHGRGVIHRDLKPANILVGPSDFAKVTDFGIAKVLQPDGNETAFSAAGLQVGTVNYMAPEQISAKNVDARTDIYLLATTLYVCLTGSFPYTGDAVVYQKLREDPTPLKRHVPNISTELEAVVMKCLARKPEARYQRMSELAEALRKVIDRR